MAGRCGVAAEPFVGGFLPVAAVSGLGPVAESCVAAFGYGCVGGEHDEGVVAVVVDGGGDAAGFAGACVVVGSVVAVGVCPAVLGEEGVPVGRCVVSAGWQVWVVEEVVVVAGFGAVDLGLDGRSRQRSRRVWTTRIG